MHNSNSHPHVHITIVFQNHRGNVSNVGQGGEVELKLLEKEEDRTTLRDAMDEYNNSFILK